jgi:macrolide transport system ATP-binding/permease protein
MREWIWRVKAMLRRGRMAAEKVEELELHIGMEVEAGLRQGLSAEEARRRARLRVGLVSEGVELAREELGFRWLDSVVIDLRHAFRALTRNRGFGTVTMLVLSASVAINTLIFCMLDGVVLRPLPYQSPEQLVRLYDSTAGTPKFPMALGRYLDYRANAKSLQSIALYTGGSMELTASRGHSKQLIAVAITPDYFAVLGKAPFLGRAFTAADLHTGVRKVILSYRLWRDRFQSDPAILGKAIRLDREPWTVIGIAPERFQHIGGDYRSPLQGETVDIWAPLTLDGPEMMIRAYHFCNAVARIRDGFTAAQARKELEILAARYSQRYPDFGKWTVRMEPLLNEITGRSRQVVWLLAMAGGLVLLVACANIAGLCLARAVTRQKELALRRALGATRWQLVRVGLTENLLIGVAGAILGLLLANAGLPLLRRLLPTDFPRAHEIAVTGMAAAFAAAIAIATVLIAGVLPWGASNALQSQRVTSGRDSRRLRSVLVAGEIALAGLLCAGALFLLRSYWEISARDHGFNSAGALTFHLRVPRTGDAGPGTLARVYGAILLKIGEIPGVASAGASTNLPWSGYDENSGFEIVGAPPDRNNDKGGRYQAATPGYFEAAGMRLLNGRLFDRARDAKGQPFTLIVNDALAKRYFPNGKAVGASLRVAGQNRRIIGVVEGIQDSPADLDTKPAFWFPFEQSEYESLFFVVRSARADPASLTPAVTAAGHAVDPEVALDEIQTLQSRADSALAGRRFALWLFQSFAILALALAAAGIYGLLAYSVQQRHKELGIRAALGASRADLWKMILCDGLKMASAGAFCCLLLAPLGGSFLRSFLYNVKAFDLLTVAGAPAVLLTVAVLASLGPARSATRSDPAFALREN